LTKPVRKQSLLKAIVKALAPKPPGLLTPQVPAVRPKPQTAPCLKNGTRLLLVEDNEDNQKLAIRLLEKYGFICDIASNGLEAMAKLAQQSYPLVLMDCQMPLMDGFETTIAIRKHEQGRPRRTPIIAMTAHALPEDREKCLPAGMDDYLSKPISEQHLVKAIHRWLQLADAASEPAERHTADRLQVHAKAGLEDLIPGYLANRRHDLLALYEAVNRGDLPAARTIGHGMKGSGHGYGFPAISEIGRSIEQCASSQDAAGIVKQVSSLEDYLLRLEVVY
jgi:CheY-like chemotaxis protein